MELFSSYSSFLLLFLVIHHRITFENSFRVIVLDDEEEFHYRAATPLSTCGDLINFLENLPRFQNKKVEMIVLHFFFFKISALLFYFHSLFLVCFSSASASLLLLFPSLLLLFCSSSVSPLFLTFFFFLSDCGVQFKSAEDFFFGCGDPFGGVYHHRVCKQLHTSTRPLCHPIAVPWGCAGECGSTLGSGGHLSCTVQRRSNMS